MAYYDVYRLRSDVDFMARVAACYAIERQLGVGLDPGEWSQVHAWEMAAQPGFGDAYAYAIASDNETPGRDPAVVTDEQILAAVQAING
jgi:hypothetical protein